MRTFLIVTVVALATPLLNWGQQVSEHQANRAELLIKQLRSDDSDVRSKAFEKLRSDPALLRDSRTKTALVNLLDHENHETASGEEEDYAEYVSRLTETVAKLVDWDDKRQVCVLADSVVLPDELANHARVAVPCLLQRLKGALPVARGAAVALLIQAMSKGRSDLDSSTIQTIQQVTVNALHDPDPSVRIPTVKALEHFGETDMIPALTVVAKTDPDPSEGYAIRKWAAEAISAIEKRASER
jgi:HEAT repeat protein